MRENDDKKQMLEEIKTWIDDFSKGEIIFYIKKNDPSPHKFAEQMLDKYYGAPMDFLEKQRDLSIEYHKKIFSIYTSIIVAVIGLFMSIIYVEIIKSWKQIFNVITTICQSIDFFWGNIATLGVIIIMGIIFFGLIRCRIYPYLSAFNKKAENYGDIERYVISKVMERKGKNHLKKSLK